MGGLLFLVGLSAGGQSLIFGVVKDIYPHKMLSTASGFTNMAIVSGGLLIQPMIGRVLDFYWDGSMINGVRAYNLHSYQIGLSVIPVLLLVSVFISIVFIRETHCKNLS
jgi:hypothetical protein